MSRELKKLMEEEELLPIVQEFFSSVDAKEYLYQTSSSDINILYGTNSACRAVNSFYKWLEKKENEST